MIPRLAAVLVLSAGLGACDAPQLTGIATGLGQGLQAPERPLADPSEATFAFEPFEGVPGNVGDDLLRRLWERAEREGLTVVKRPGGPARFTVEGTLTAVSDDANATVFYVFEVRDVTGRRLHRISGRQRSDASSGDPWSSIEPRDLDRIAVRVAALIEAWLQASA